MKKRKTRNLKVVSNTAMCLNAPLWSHVRSRDYRRTWNVWFLCFSVPFSFAGQKVRFREGSTVEPVLSGPVLSGHPLLSGQLSKSRKLLPLITVILTSIKRSRSPFAKFRRAVSIVLTCIKRPLCKRKPLKYYSSSYKYK